MCKHKDIFGKPNEGFHKAQIFGVAAFDLIGTVVIAWLLNKWLKISFWKVFLGLMIIAILLHKLFCVETTLNKKLGI